MSDHVSSLPKEKTDVMIRKRINWKIFAIEERA